MLRPLFHALLVTQDGRGVMPGLKRHYVPVYVGAGGDATCDPEGADGSLDLRVRACLIARGTFRQPPGACLICSAPFAGST